MSTRTRITADDGYPNRCSMRTEEDGSVRVLDYYAPADGGYVREHWLGCRQVCEWLGTTGRALTWKPDSRRYPTLAHLIRAEHKKRQAAERREMRR